MKKKVVCPNCNGYGFIARCDSNKAWSERCAECNGIGEIEVPLTNGDLFRRRSDEDNAQWLSKLVFHNCATTFECQECHPDDEGCAEEILKWLKKEAKDGCI
ncbi:MAG: hypothetical protein SO471_08045 [Anaerobutyricum hallii]|uniref:hypothetical protein n=1 Tax=Anaerobutyricum hallii TaxID=39488 RepID=UPI002A82A506|nr:hypothetical protein [Anaerobutyricum hallii]MDY4577901.1 hypothetical protein [Anaerobutyricum hallii]